MPRIEKKSDFARVLSTLPLEHQHKLAKKFISGVMHLSAHPRLNPLFDLLQKPECSVDDLKRAHSIAHSVYVETAPGSDMSEVKMTCQATHFISQAVLTCSTPDSKGASTAHLANKVANYCRMAQTCTSMCEGGEDPDFAHAEAEYNRIVNEQIDTANQFLDSEGF